MKKMLIVLLTLAIAAGGVFADITWSGDLNTGLSFYKADKTGDDDGYAAVVNEFDDGRPDERTRGKIVLGFAGDNYGGSIAFKSQSSDEVVKLDDARGWFSLLGGVVKITAARNEPHVWKTAGALDFKSDNGGGTAIDISPIEGLTIGFVLRGAEWGQGNSSNRGGAIRLGDFLAETTFGVSYSLANIADVVLFYQSDSAVTDNGKYGHWDNDAWKRTGEGTSTSLGWIDTDPTTDTDSDGDFENDKDIYAPVTSSYDTRTWYNEGKLGFGAKVTALKSMGLTIDFDLGFVGLGQSVKAAGTGVPNFSSGTWEASDTFNMSRIGLALKVGFETGPLTASLSYKNKGFIGDTNYIDVPTVNVGGNNISGLDFYGTKGQFFSESALEATVGYKLNDQFTASLGIKMETGFAGKDPEKRKDYEKAKAANKGEGEYNDLFIGTFKNGILSFNPALVYTVAPGQTISLKYKIKIDLDDKDKDSAYDTDPADPTKRKLVEVVNSESTNEVAILYSWSF